MLAGGPGTGKTTTVSRLLALLREQHPDWRIALAAPTGKAAARLEEAVRSSTATLPAEDRLRLGELSATTLHRLLGWRPEARSRFRHDRTNRLPVEVVVVDEASMVSLTMMARLLEALRPTTRLVLVGDPDQLASVEAGAVLGDLADASRPPVELPRRLRQGDRRPGRGSPSRRWRPTGGSRRPAASRCWRPPCRRAAATTRWTCCGRPTPPRSSSSRSTTARTCRPTQLDGVRADVVVSGAALLDAAERGDAAAALEALDRHRLLCAHRRGPRGVQHWSALAARWIADEHPVLPRADGRYAGEPLLVTANDYEIGLYNGDTGVVVDDGNGGLIAAFGRGGDADRRAARPARRGPAAARDDRAPQPGQPVRPHHRAAAGGRLTARHPRDALHGGDPGDRRTCA